MSSISLDDLNPAQCAAVLAPDGPILILAGAGSGKTRVLTYRIAYLLAERGATAQRTLAVTFTNKAAGEMRERIAAMVGESNNLPWVSTFHALCARVLRQEAQLLGYTRNFTILDESDALATIRRRLKQYARELTKPRTRQSFPNNSPTLLPPPVSAQWPNSMRCTSNACAR